MTAPAYAFTDPAPPEPERTRLLGGKGAGLVMMTQELGLPVPPGFTVPTSVCLDYLAHGWPTGLNGTLAEHLGRLEQAMGLRLGDPAAPLLVSVRSGAPISMPGMMDTVLNVGITPAVRDAIAAKDARFAADTWLRFSHMYASTVLGLDLGSAPKPETSIADLLAAADAVHRAAAAAGTPIPLDPQLQLRGAVEAVFRSWTSARAVAYRRHEGIPEDLGTAVTLQAMVFGNADERSGSGVVFTRDPATGANTPFGDYLPCAQGEDVVAGTHAVHGLHLLAKQLPAVDAELRAALRRLELHTRDMCDVEFTVDRGRLFILQTRVGKRSPIAAVTIAVDLTDDPEIRLTRAEAVARVAPDTLQKAAAAETVVAGATPVGRGLAASPGVGTGALCFDPDRAAELAAAGTPVALARQETSPEDVHGMLAASAILTTLGGVASHAAVVARGWGIPAITSLANARVAGGTLEIAGHVLREGDIVTVDGTDGALYLGDQRAEGAAADSAHLTELRAWAAEIEESATTASPPASAALDLYALARVVQLKGLCAKERAAANLGASPEAVEALTGDHPELFKATPRGVAVTPAGRAWVLAELAKEREAAAPGALDAAYTSFTALDRAFKQLVTAWQQSLETRDRAATARDLADHDAQARSVATAAAHVFPRLATYPPRLSAALGAFASGDDSMLASPLKDSYHTVWFELHEELIALSGRDRATEEAAGH